MKKNAKTTLSTLLINPKSWSDYYIKLKALNDSGEQKLAGTIFEEFCYLFLKTDPVRKHLYKEIYRQKDIPHKIKEKLHLASNDHGIDLLLIDKKNQIVAVQCKFKSDESSYISWSKDKLANVIAEAKNADGLIIMTNASGIDKHTDHKGLKEFKSFNLISYSHFSSIDKPTIKNLYLASQNKKKINLKPAKPRDYQQKAIRDVINGFKKSNRGQLILPCGAGKTLTSLWIKEALKPKLTLVMVPSLALLRQTLEEWNKHQKSWSDYICVCSEKGIDSAVENDSNVSHTYEIPAVTTQPKDILEFLKQSGPKTVFATYQSAHVIKDALRKSKIKFDLSFCDEAHKTAGDRKSAFGLIHDDKNIPIKRRLYMTATPKIVSEQVKTKLGDDVKYLADMSDPKTFGTEFYRMEFGYAIKKGILCDYKIIAIGVSNEEIKKNLNKYVTSKHTAADLANNYALSKVMKKYNSTHAITFHSSIKRAKEFSEKQNEINAKSNAALVTGEQPTNFRKRLLDNFKNEKTGILSNARCLTEGIDVPAIDCVYFCDPRNSKVDIVQASGRALRQAKHKNKNFGYIVVPIFHNNKAKVEKAIDNSTFKNLIQVVRALSDQDERLVVEMNNLKLGNAKFTKNSRIQFNLSDKENLSIAINLKALEKHLFDQIVAKSVSRWDSMILQLKDFKKKFGHANPTFESPKQWKNLAEWAHFIRKDYRLNLLKWNKISELSDIGFVWTISGVTLDDTKGLLNEKEFSKFSGLSNIGKYRTRCLIKPFGTGLTNAGISYFYQPKQSKELKKKLGVTLDSTKGLISQKDFIKLSGLTNITKYRKQGLIKPVGKAIISGSKLSYFYKASQILELKKKIGITLTDTKGLISEKELMIKTGLWMIASYREKGIIKPAGRAISHKLTYFYKPSQIQYLMNKLGITLKSTKGLMNEREFMIFCNNSAIRNYRLKGIIKPIGTAMSKVGISFYYHPRQKFDLKRKLGITLDNTKNLMNEAEFIKHSGLTQIRKYRNQGLIKPVGTAISKNNVGYYYKPSQARTLKNRLGITLVNTNGLLNEAQFRKLSGINKIEIYRKKGLIKPIGRGMTKVGIGYFYHPNQIKELKNNLDNLKKSKKVKL